MTKFYNSFPFFFFMHQKVKFWQIYFYRNRFFLQAQDTREVKVFVNVFHKYADTFVAFMETYWSFDCVIYYDIVLIVVLVLAIKEETLILTVNGSCVEAIMTFWLFPFIQLCYTAMWAWRRHESLIEYGNISLTIVWLINNSQKFGGSQQSDCLDSLSRLDAKKRHVQSVLKWSNATPFYMNKSY